jgi:prolyl 4-hydroxylase
LKTTLFVFDCILGSDSPEVRSSLHLSIFSKEFYIETSDFESLAGRIFRFVVFALMTAGLTTMVQAQERTADYGADCSYPIHSKEWRCGDLLGDRKKVYDEYMDGCRKRYGDKGGRCDFTEDERLEMSVRQPQSMVNFTSSGYKKIKAPKEVFDLLLDYWEENKDDSKLENWPVGNIYTNHWAAPTYLVSVEDKTIRGDGYQLKQKIWEAAKTTIEEWTGMEQKPISLYGIRKYTNGSVLSPHVDRMPLVSSCIVNVAQDVDEPWPLEVYDREGKAVNVTMEPGDMVLYESASLIHGRPFALKGRYFANIFIHFEPTGRKLGDTSDDYLEELDDFYPPYLLPNSPEVPQWTSDNPQGWQTRTSSPAAPVQQIHAPEAHKAAAFGDVERLMMLAKRSKLNLHRKDVNGWQPIHEAARAGNKEVVELLIKHGVQKDARTGHREDGCSPLNIAMRSLDADHEVILFLMSIGAQNFSEEL